MTTYYLTLSMIVISAILLSTKTEQSRVVTIQRPMLITQERKTPAYLVYRQMQKLEEKKRVPAATPIAATTYLSHLSLKPKSIQIKLAEMKFDKNEFAAPAPTIYQLAQKELSSERHHVITNKTYDQVFNAKNVLHNFSEEFSQPEYSASPSKKWATIRGKFELTDGVGVVDHIIELKRIEEGRVREAGYIDLKAGLYSIDIESPRGYLLASIKERSGRLIGEDRERIINLQSRGNFYEGPFLRVGHPDTVAANPYFPGSSKTSVASTASSSNRASAQSSIAVTIFDNEKTFDKPEETFSNISRYSTTIGRVYDPRRIYKNITTIRHTGDKSETPMFTVKWLEGAIDYISDIKKIEFKSKNAPVIMGRVLVNGKPVSGAEVQIPFVPGLLPVYFDQFMIPALNQTTTSENGYFMFVGLEPDNYQVVVSRNGINLTSQMFIAEEDFMAFQNIATTDAPKTKIIRSFDAFTSEPMKSDVVLAEVEEALEATDGVANYKTYTVAGVDEFLARTEDREYLPIRYVQNARKEYVHLPLIKNTWLDAIKNAKNIIANPDAGIIIGFTTELEYNAYLTEEAHNKNDIVYFDSSGNISPEPVVGGGFVLFNVPTGAQEVVLQDKSNEKIYSQVFNINAQQVSVAHFAIDL